MAINIKFDLANNPEMPTIILANRSGNKLGKLDARDIELNDKFNGTSEMTFTLNKYVDGKLTNLWDKVVNFKLIYCKEWDMWFEIQVELDEATQSTKTVFCVQLGQAELSQIMIYNMTINQEGDSNWNEDEKEYKKTILYNPNDPSASLLNRLLKDKAPHYSIIHVDSTIANIQRMFDFDGTSIYDAFMEIAEEIGCLFVFHSNSDKNGKIQRTISVYDLQQNCLNKDCAYRGEFTDKCPECGSTNIRYGYGEDTTIFVTADELASEGIQLQTDTDAVKNCFKLEAGDDLITATIRNCNPNGTDYIWYFSDDMKSDMSKELVDKINAYDELYDEYYNNYSSNIDVSSYNALINKYKAYEKDLQTITTPIKGYSALMNAYYNTVDLALYLESGLMPSVEIAETNAIKQAALLTSASLSPVAVNVKELSSVSLATADSAVLSMAKVIVKSTFKVEIDSSSISDDKTTWTGNFIITNYSDEEDKVTTSNVAVSINNDAEAFIQQKINKALNKDNTDNLSISGLFAKDYYGFCEELKKYALNPLDSFYKSCETCLSILQEQGVASEETWSDDTEGSDANLYEKLYVPYYNKSQAIASEIAIRENEIAVIKGVYTKDKDDNEVLKTKGVQHYINECKDIIQSALNFEDYIGNDLWVEFCSYRREDKYSNDNYISDGLNNAELFNKAKEFIKVAEDEIYKSAELQHSISTTLNNLLAIKKFKPLVNHFSVGNWMRVRVDDEVYKLRLLDYSIDYSSFDTIPVTFSDVTKIRTGITDVQEVLSQASSMATSYSSVQKQAKQGDDAKGTVDQWLANGLNSAQVRIQSNNTEDVVLDRNGLLCRSYNEITDTYDPEQFKLTHNIMAYTKDNWKTVSQAIGKHDYVTYNKSSDVWDTTTGYGMSADFVTAGQVTGSTIVGGLLYSSNYHSGKFGGSPLGTYINLNTGDFEFGGKKLVYNSSDDTLSLSGVTIEWSNSNKPDMEVTDISGLEKYVDQLDGMIKTYSQSADPSKNWTETEKTDNVGDLWFNPDDGLTKRWNGSSWDVIEDKGLKELAQSKARIFTVTPTPPYNRGDLWTQGATGDIMHCVNAKVEGESYSANDWKKSSKYTDDAAVTEVKNGIGFTKIGEDYVIAPYIKGGQLDISPDGLTTSAQITSDGKLICTDADVGGKITADEGEIGGFTIASTNLWNGINSFSGTVTDTDETGSITGGTKGVYIGTDGIRLGSDLKLYANGTMAAGKRIYLPNGRGLRGMRKDKSEIKWDNSNALIWINDTEADDSWKYAKRSFVDRVIVGNPANNAPTELRSPSAIFFKCHKAESDKVGRTLIFAYADNVASNYSGDEAFFMPGATNLTNLGGSNYRWKNVYAQNGDFTGTLKVDGTNVSLAGHTHSGLVASNGGKLLYTYSTDTIDGVANLEYFYSENGTSTVGKCRLGSPSHRWGALYSVNGTIQTSDRNLKRDIENIDDSYLKMFDLLEPVTYKLIDGDRTHIGFISQDVESSMKKVGLTDLDFAGLCRDISEDGQTNIYSLRYSEFIALNTAKIKQLEKQIIELKNEIMELKS